LRPPETPIKALFVRQSGAGYLLLALGIVSALLATVDTNSRLLDPVRSMLATLASPVYVFAETPYTVSTEVTESLSSRQTLVERNELLERRVLELSQISQQFVVLREENARLRELLGSRSRLGAEVLVSELIGVVPDPDTLQVMVDKGSDAGVSVGQAVIDAEGLFRGSSIGWNSNTYLLLLTSRRGISWSVPVSAVVSRRVIPWAGSPASRWIPI
jgi:rod shape-determining protein MreC